MKLNTSRLVNDWIDSWNSHNINAVLSHYSDECSLKSPAIKKVLGKSTGELNGKHAISDYWKKALEKYPQLHFELISSYEGVDCLAIHYKGINNTLVLEVMRFDGNGKINATEVLYENPLA